MISIDPSNYIQGDRALKALMDDSYHSAIAPWESHWTQSQVDRRFAVGDQKFINGISGEFYQRQKFIFNLIHAQRQMILGHQRKNRKSSLIVPIEEKDQQTADDHSACLIWTMQADNMLHKISEAFDNAIVDGLCLMHTWLDYADEPVDGIIRQRNYPNSTFIMDPWWQERNLSDCGFVWVRDYVTEKQLKNLLPGHDDTINMHKTNYNITRFSFMPESYQSLRRKKSNYAYDQFYYMTTRKAKVVHIFDLDKTFEFEGDDDDLEIYLKMKYWQQPEILQSVRVISQEKPCVHLGIAVNDVPVYDGYYSDYYPFTPMLAYFEPESPQYAFRFYGIVRPIRDTQYLFNRRMQIQLDTLESLPASGVNVVEDALLDKMDAYKQGAGQVRVVKKGYIPDQVISQIMPPQIDMSAFKMTDDLGALSQKIIGINEELMGSADDSKAGITEMLRQGASLTTLQTLFDNLDLSQKYFSIQLMRRIQDNFSEKRIERILGRPSTDEFFDKSFNLFDCEIEDGLNTSTQKQQQFSQLLKLREIGVPVSPQMLLKCSTLQNKNELIEDVEQQMQQQAQQAQMQAQQEMMVAQANMDLLSSQAEANRAMGIERVSRVNENQMMAYERRAEAMKDQEMALLNQARAVKEIQGIDLNQIEQAVKILSDLKILLQSQQQKEAENGLRNNSEQYNYGQMQGGVSPQPPTGF